MRINLALYTCNVMIDDFGFEKKVEAMSNTLKKLGATLDTLSIKGVFFIDTELFFIIREKYPQCFQKIVSTCNRLSRSGHTFSLLITLARTSFSDIYQIHQEELLDIFARGKYIIQRLYGKKDLNNNPAVRIYHSKMQPFSYLQEGYQMFKAKVDMSIVPKIKTANCDFRTINVGEIIRFTNNPNSKERFGQYLGISRGICEVSKIQHMNFKSRLHKVSKHQPEHIQSWLCDKTTLPELKTLPISTKQHIKILSPDALIFKDFKSIMEKQRKKLKDICVLESHIEDVSHITQENITWLQSTNNSSFSFVSLQELAESNSATYKK